MIMPGESLSDIAAAGAAGSAEDETSCDVREKFMEEETSDEDIVTRYALRLITCFW